MEELNLVEEENIKEIDEVTNYSIIQKDWLIYKDIIDFKIYNIVLDKYKILFKDNKRNLKVNVIDMTKVEEYNKYIQFNEELIALYESLKNSNNARVFKLISNIIYICSELVDYGNSQDGKENKYLAKIRKYIELKKNKQ